MKHKLPRRQLLSAGSAWASLLAAGECSRGRARAYATANSGLVRDRHGLLDLPAGYTYRVVSQSGEPMSDGYRVPANPDAMGTFQTPEGLVLMRNHEVAPGDARSGPYPRGRSAPPEAYDPDGHGGVTKLLFDPTTLELKSQQLALCGTHWNCAGGPSPWGWLSCEEIFVPLHGYVFLAPLDAPQLTAAKRIPAYGRFRHEAAAVDARTHIAYLSEDREDAAFYRFVPDQHDQPFVGKLQALRVLDAPGFETSGMRTGQRLRIDWVDVPEPDPSEDNVRLQARACGAARFARTEGMWLTPNELFLCATAGGPIGRGQIFRLDHAAAEPVLSVVAQSDDPNVLDMPDNITVSPHGELFVAEDGLEGNLLRRISPQGEIRAFACNTRSPSEFAGPCFAPDGRTMFVNLQRDGLTLAIHGPFEQSAGDLAAADDVGKGPFAGVAGLGAGAAVLAFAALTQRKRNALAR